MKFGFPRRQVIQGKKFLVFVIGTLKIFIHAAFKNKPLSYCEMNFAL